MLTFKIEAQVSTTGIIYINRNDTVPELKDLSTTYDGFHIIFPCNKTYFDPSQGDWQQLNNIIYRLTGDTLRRLEGIHMYGAASPEGPYYNNVYLSVNRLKRVADSLAARYDSISILYSTANVPEDYQRLLYQTRSDSIYYNIIYNAIAKSDAETKRNLQKNPDNWNYLLKEYYPELRAVNIILYVREYNHKIILGDIQNYLPKICYVNITTNGYKPVELSYNNISYRRQPMLRLKSNLIYDVGGTPNWMAEFLPKRGHISYNLGMIWAGFRNDNKYRTWIIHAYEAGLRYYINNVQYQDWFIYGLVGFGKYDIQLRQFKSYLSKRYLYNNKAELGVGYLYYINNNLSVEMSVGFGSIYSKYDRYHGAEEWATEGQFYYDWHLHPKEFERYRNRFRWFGPTNINLSISYDIAHYRKQRR